MYVVIAIQIFAPFETEKIVVLQFTMSPCGWEIKAHSEITGSKKWDKKEGGCTPILQSLSTLTEED